jgi:hypothetical protein
MCVLPYPAPSEARPPPPSAHASEKPQSSSPPSPPCDHPGEFIVVDHRSGDTVCSKCAHVVEERMLLERREICASNSLLSDPISVPAEVGKSLGRSLRSSVLQACSLLNLPGAESILEETAKEYDSFAVHINLSPQNCTFARRSAFLALAFSRVLFRADIYRLPTLLSGFFGVPNAAMFRAEKALCNCVELQYVPLRWPSHLLMTSACRWLRLKPPLEKALVSATKRVEQIYYGHGPETIMVAVLKTAIAHFEKNGQRSPINMEEVTNLFQIRHKTPSLKIASIVAHHLDKVGE